MFKWFSAFFAAVAAAAFCIGIGVYFFADPSVHLIILALREVIFYAATFALILWVLHAAHKYNQDRLRISE